MSVASNERDLGRIVTAVQQIEQGRLNVTGQVTLAAGTTKTTVKAMNCGAQCEVFLSPRTANAAAAVSTTYVSSVVNGGFELTHLNNAQTDRTFGFACLG